MTSISHRVLISKLHKLQEALHKAQRFTPTHPLAQLLTDPTGTPLDLAEAADAVEQGIRVISKI